MKHLILHIEYLLLRHDCVIVPGLGAFIASVAPARIDCGKGVALPPVREIMFNQAVTTDDGLLTNSFARKNGISFEEARQMIFREVSILKESLLSSGKCLLGKIGMLLLGEENTIVFVPSSNGKSLSAIIGLPEIKFLSSDNSQLSVIPSCSTSRKKSFIRKYGKYAASVLVVAAIAVATLLYPLPSDDREQKASVVPVDALFTKHPTPQTATKAATTSTDEARICKEPIEAVPTFYLIVATFSSKTDAEKFAESFSSADFPLTTVSTKKVTRVAVASSNDKEELQRKLNSSEISSRFSNPWIWEQK